MSVFGFLNISVSTFSLPLISNQYFDLNGSLNFQYLAVDVLLSSITN